MQTNGHNLDEQLTGWPHDARLARIVIHVDVAQAIFDSNVPEWRREFQTPEEMFAYAVMLRERQQKTTTLARILESGLRVFRKFTFTNKGGT